MGTMIVSRSERKSPFGEFSFFKWAKIAKRLEKGGSSPLFTKAKKDGILKERSKHSAEGREIWKDVCYTVATKRRSPRDPILSFECAFWRTERIILWKKTEN